MTLGTNTGSCMFYICKYLDLLRDNSIAWTTRLPQMCEAYYLVVGLLRLTAEVSFDLLNTRELNRQSVLLALFN